MWYAVAVLVVVVLFGCDDGPVGPMERTEIVLDTVMNVNGSKLLGFNDSGQALWRSWAEDPEGRQWMMWNGTDVVELPFRAESLGSEGEVIGHTGSGTPYYWKNGQITEAPGEISGIDGEGRVLIYDGEPKWWTPEEGILGPAPGTNPPTLAAEDGSVLVDSVEIIGPLDGLWYCNRVTEEGSTLLVDSECRFVNASTVNGLFLIGSRVIDTSTDPWTEVDFQFHAWDLNEDALVISSAGVHDLEGTVLDSLELDAAHALLNNHRNILVMTFEGVVKIIE